MKRSLAVVLMLCCLAACRSAPSGVYHDESMDFGAVRSVAVMPFANFTRETQAAERVRDVFVTHLFASGSIYVIPPGEVKRGVQRTGINEPAAPSPEEIVKFAAIVKVDAVITGAVREYGEIRSGQSSSGVVALSVSMIEAQTGKVVWSASSTRGGIGLSARLFGGGGRPMDDVTEQAVKDVLDKLFK